MCGWPWGRAVEGFCELFVLQWSWNLLEMVLSPSPDWWGVTTLFFMPSDSSFQHCWFEWDHSCLVSSLLISAGQTLSQLCLISLVCLNDPLSRQMSFTWVANLLDQTNTAGGSLTSAHVSSSFWATLTGHTKQSTCSGYLKTGDDEIRKIMVKQQKHPNCLRGSHTFRQYRVRGYRI